MESVNEKQFNCLYTLASRISSTKSHVFNLALILFAAFTMWPGNQLITSLYSYVVRKVGEVHCRNTFETSIFKNGI